MKNSFTIAVVAGWVAVATSESSADLALAITSGLIVAVVALLLAQLLYPFAKNAYLRRCGLRVEILDRNETEDGATSVELVVGLRYPGDITVESLNFRCVPTKSISSDAPQYDEATVHTRSAAPLGRQDRPSPTVTSSNDKFNGLTVNFLSPESLTLSSDSRERFQVVIEANDTVDGYFGVMAYADGPDRVRGRLPADGVLLTPTQKPSWRQRFGLSPT